MRDLIDTELDLVAGGKSNGESGPLARLQQWWQAIKDAFSSGGSSGGPAITVSASDLGQMLRDCRASGGQFSLAQTASAGSASMRVVNADGSESYFNMTCTDG